MANSVIGLLVLVLLSACIYIPDIGPKPYKEERLNKIVVGETTRDEILEEFGDGYRQRYENSVWIYAESRIMGHIIDLNGTVISGFDYQLLVIDFEGDLVKNISLGEDLSGSNCVPSGICVPWGLDFSDGVIDEHVSFIVSSIRDDDKIAKQFETVEGSCAIYVYQDYGVGVISLASSRSILLNEEFNNYHVIQPGIHNIIMNEETYSYHVIQPGLEVLTAIYGYLWVVGSTPETEHHEFTCAANDVRFFRIYDKPLSWGINLIIEEVDPATGRNEITKRSLNVPPQHLP